MAVLAHAEQRDVQHRRGAEHEAERRGVFARRARGIGIVAGHAMHARPIGPERREQQPLDRGEVRVGVPGRHAALVAEEQVHERPVDVRADQRGQEALGHRTAGYGEREAAPRRLRGTSGRGGAVHPALGERGDRRHDDGGLVSHGLHRWLSRVLGCCALRTTASIAQP